MSKLLDLVDGMLKQLSRTGRRRHSHGEDVFLIDKKGRVREHRQSSTTINGNTITRTERRRIRIIQP